MHTFITSRLDNIQITPPSDNYSSQAWKYTKIITIALTIFSACAAIFYIYRHYRAQQLKANDTVLPSHISPKPPAKDTPKSPDVPPKPQDNDESKKGMPDPKKTHTASPNQQELDDLELAKRLQEDLLKEEDGQDATNTGTEISDEEMAKELQARYDSEDVLFGAVNPPLNLNPFTTPPPPTPAQPSPVILSPPSPTPDLTVSETKEDPKSSQPSPFVQIEKICGEIAEKTFQDPSFSAVKALSAVPRKTQQEALNLLNEIIAEFERRYQYPDYKKIKYGQKVPAYFANVSGGESTVDRKYLSLVGIRNLLLVGPSIIDDFRDTKYLGGEGNYLDDKGLKKFKYYTGNTVDLDTEIEAKNDLDALRIAEEAIVKFGKICGVKKSDPGNLTAADVAKEMSDRKLHLPQPSHYGTFIHTAIDNNDRSNHGIWKRIAPTGYHIHYYVNVPDCNIALIATLRMPYLIAEIAYRTKKHNGGKLTSEFYDEFFDKGVSDKCFNDKARTFMDFYINWNAKLDGVPSVEEDARRKIENGTFGETLRNKGSEVVLKEAFNRMTLINYLDGIAIFECKKRTLKKFIEDEEENIRQILKDYSKWEQTLYQIDKEGDFFLLNQATLNGFIKDYYEYLKGLE